ncbi:MAG TPA: hypothetical protein VEG44_04170 [Candidatus Acidoferrales bacterium]|nr:hypothetical protein [Candidatus Acidoferrales bacterium]
MTAFYRHKKENDAVIYCLRLNVPKIEMSKCDGSDGNTPSCPPPQLRHQLGTTESALRRLQLLLGHSNLAVI